MPVPPAPPADGPPVSVCVFPHAQPATPTPIKSTTTAIPPLATIVANHSLSTGNTIDQIPTANIVQPTPARKLFRCVCSDGRYRNPEPEECGGIMKIS